MKVLVIAAHPDDEIYGMGGTIAKLTQEGNEVYVLIVTEGCSSQYVGDVDKIAIKKKEANRANSMLGVKEVLFGDLPDMKLDAIAHVEINNVIEKAVREIQPDIVYTHHHGDVNIDHQKVFESTMVAVRPTATQCVQKVYCYQVPSSTEWHANNEKYMFLANTFEEVGAQYELKQQAILAYESELREAPHPRSVETVSIYDTALGRQVGLKKAEGFVLIRSVRRG